MDVIVRPMVARAIVNNNKIDPEDTEAALGFEWKAKQRERENLMHSPEKNIFNTYFASGPQAHDRSSIFSSVFTSPEKKQPIQ